MKLKQLKMQYILFIFHTSLKWYNYSSWYL